MQKEIHPVKWRKAPISPKEELFNWVNWLLKEKYHNRAVKNFYKDVERLKRGEPLDYVIGFTDFLGCKIDLSKKPLIPRQETEFWTEKAIEDIKKFSDLSSLRSLGQSLRILDIFAGSGCIGIAVLKNIKNSRVDFADVDKNNLKQIRINLKINKIKPGRGRVICSDVFKNIKGSYDYILANPPYIAKNRKNKIQKSVLKFEPNRALFGGGDGLFYIKKFLKDAKNHLRPAGGGYPDGKIYMEFDHIQRREIGKLLKKFGYHDYKFNKDQYGKFRWVEVD